MNTYLHRLGRTTAGISRWTLILSNLWNLSNIILINKYEYLSAQARAHHRGYLQVGINSWWLVKYWWCDTAYVTCKDMPIYDETWNGDELACFYCGEQQVMVLDTCGKCDKHMCHTCLDVTGGCCSCHLTDERTVVLDSFTPDPQEGKVTTFKKKQKRVVKEGTDLVKRQGQRMQHQHIYLRRWCDSAMPPMISANWVSSRSSTLRGFPFSRHLDHSRSSSATRILKLYAKKEQDCSWFAWTT